MEPALFDVTLRNAWLAGPDGVGCEPAAADTLTGLEEIICDLLQPAKTTDAEKAAIPLNSWRRERSVEGVELSMSPIEAMVSLHSSRSANQISDKPSWYPPSPLSCNRLARYQIGSNEASLCRICC